MDPNYGRAYGALAVSLAASFVRGWSDAPNADLDQGLALAQKAVALDASTPQTHFALAFVHVMRKHYDDALQAAMESVRIAPSYADGYALLGFIYMFKGQLEAAIEQNAKGMRLNPYFSYQYLITLGGTRYMLGQYDTAIETLEKAQERNENDLLVKFFLAASYVKAGRDDDAKWLMHRLEMTSPTTTITDVAKALPISDPAIKGALLDDLRKAGMQE